MATHLWIILLALALTNGQRDNNRIPVGAILGTGDSSAERAFTHTFQNGGESTSEGLLFEFFVEHVDLRDTYLVSKAVSALSEKHSVLTLLVPTMTPVLSWMTSHRYLPLVSLRSSSLPSSSPGGAVEVSPDPQLALIDVMRSYKWSSLHYFYQDDDGLQRLQTLQQIGSGSLNLSSWHLHRVEDSHEGRSLLRQMDIDQANARGFVVLDLDPDLSAQILSDFSKTTYIEKKHFHFLLAQPMDDTFWQESFLHELCVSGLRLYDPATLPDELGLENQRNLYGSATEWLLARDAARLVQSAFNRLSLNEPSVLRSIMEQGNSSSETQQRGALLTKYLRETMSEGFTPGALQFDPSRGKRRGFTLDIMEANPNGPVKAFTWSDATGLNPLAPSYQQRMNLLLNKTLIVSTILNEPYLMLRDAGADTHLEGNDAYEGFTKDLVELLAHKVGFKYELKIVSDGRYGSRASNGSWNGMIGEVIKREADVAIADLTITSERQKYVDMSYPYMTIGISLMIKKPDSSSMGPLAPGSAYFFVSPFATEVWGCLLLAMVVVGVTHFAIGRLLAKANPSWSTEGSSSTSSLLDSLWFAFGSLFLRQTGLLPKSFSSRVLSGVWWVFAFFVLALYVTSLVCLLVTSEMGTNGLTRGEALSRKSTLEIMEESVTTGYPEIGCIHSGSTRAFFLNSRLPLYARFSEVLKNHPDRMAKTSAEGINRVRQSNGAYAFFMESSTNEYETGRKCDTMMVPQLLDSKGYGIATSKGSPYGLIFDQALLYLREIGDLERIYNKWWIPVHTCDQKDVGKKIKVKLLKATVGTYVEFCDLYHSSMTLGDMAGVFYFLVAGFLLTLMVSFGEVLHSRRSDSGMHRVALTNITNKGEIDQLNGENLHNDRSSF